MEEETTKLKKEIKLVCPNCKTPIVIKEWVETLTPAVKAEKNEYFTIEKDLQTTLDTEEETLDTSIEITKKPKQKKKKAKKKSEE